MIIDFHTHIFPERIAARTLSILSERGGIAPCTDGTEAGLLHEMETAGISLAVTLPVLTSPTQFESVNRYACDVNRRFAAQSGRRLLSFGGIHPACEDIGGKMEYLRSEGFLGVKIHPDYQETFIDGDGYREILFHAKRLDMIVVTHAGADIAYRGQPVRCTPARVKELIRAVPYGKLVLAHMGGSEMTSEVLDELCGEDVYFDTSFVLPHVEKDTLRAIIARHGASRILFGTDSPWCGAKVSLSVIRSLSLGEEAEEKILSQNAKKLLGLS